MTKFFGYFFWVLALIFIFFGQKNAVAGEPSFIIYNGGMVVSMVLGTILLKKSKSWD